MYYPYFRQCPTGAVPYTVKPGDTYFKLAQQFNITVPAIINANPTVNPNQLVVGQQLCIPRQPVYPSCPEGNYYTIKPGDTLYAIARFFNVSLDDLLEANPGINPNMIMIGQVICIPLATPPVTCPTGIFPYIVRRGDTFYSIARMFGVTIELLMRTNAGINPNALLIGQKLCIPRTGNRYLNSEYNISFLYPVNWNKIDETRYEGMDGFFQISAIGSNQSLDQVCTSEASHKLKPYGSQPVINKLKIDGQNACLILPYSDQPKEMRDQAALIVKYPKPVQISGSKYNYFILWADKNHIREIANTITFPNR